MVNSEELSELKLASGSSSGDPSADLNHAAEGLSDQLRNVGLDEVAREESNSRNEGVDSKGAGNNQEEEDGDGWGESEKREVVYPLRPGAEDCSFYMRTGSCKFNHPLPRKIQIARDKVREKEEDADKLRLMDCKYYMRTGGCKYGETCRFNHTKPKSCLTELNFLGLPGETDCPYYMRTGSCKYGADCKFNHSGPTTIRGTDSPSIHANNPPHSNQVQLPGLHRGMQMVQVLLFQSPCHRVAEFHLKLRSGMAIRLVCIHQKGV